MKIETLQSRIENAENRIEKKFATIARKQKTIENKKKQIAKLGCDPEAKPDDLRDNSDAMWLAYDIVHLEDDIERNQKEIEEIKVNLEKYRLQLTGEMKKESMFIREIPESMKKMQEELVIRWDAHDINRREFLKKQKKELSYQEFSKKYTYFDREFIHQTDEQIHNSNLQESKIFILNLYNRIKSITGEVTDWEDICLASGNIGPVLNGYVEGKEGRCFVESILAGGYNIQRLHIRVLVKEVA